MTPTLAPFGWPIVAYLSLAGLAAGSAWQAVAALRILPGTARAAGVPLVVAMAAAAAGAAALIADLTAPERFWLILRQVNTASWISWGARILLAFGLACAGVLLAVAAAPRRDRSLADAAGGRAGNTDGGDDEPARRDRSLADAAGGGAPPGTAGDGSVGRSAATARSRPGWSWQHWLLAAVGVALSAYPALVLGQAAAHPRWHSLLLVPLLVVSAAHMGVGIWGWPGAAEVRAAAAIVAVEAALVAGYGTTAGSAALLSGPFSLWLWLGVAAMGWAGYLAAATRGGRSAAVVRATCALAGGIALRAWIVVGGQLPEAFVGVSA